MSGKLLNSEPLYVQLRVALSRRIASGDWKPGETIPNELDLAKEYGLSAGTVRKALDWMEEAKLISRQQGRGTFVTDPASKESTRRFNRLRDASGAILRVDAHMIAISTSPASKTEAARLDMGPEQRVTRMSKLASAQGRPILFEQIAVPTDLFPMLAGNEGAESTCYDLLEFAQRSGVLIGRGDERISIGVAEGEVASHLGVSPGTPLLVLDRTIRTIENRPAEWRVAWCNLGPHHYLAELS